MRMWMINPKLMCKKHLLGEHGEIHKHRHNFVKQHRIDGRMHPIVQVEPKSMQTRHDELVAEMLHRGYNHNSPYEQPDISYLRDEYRLAEVNTSISLEDLKDRCPDCKERILSSVINSDQFALVDTK